MSNPFTITAATNTMRLDDTRQAQTTFTVFNNSGRSMRGRARISPQDPASEPWLTLAGEAERDLPIAGAQQYVVKLAVPPGAPAGSYPFRLDMVGTENPDEEFSQGPTVTFEVPAPAPVKKPFPIWIPIVAVVALLVVGGVIAFLVIRPDPEKAAAVSQTATAEAQAAANATSTALAVQTQVAAGQTSTAIAAFSYDFIANADSATWTQNYDEGTQEVTLSVPFDLFIEGDRHGFAIWRDSRYRLNDGSTVPRFLEAHPPQIANGITRGLIYGCYKVMFPDGSPVRPTDRISGKIGFIEGAVNGGVYFSIFIPGLDNTAQSFIFADAHNYSEGVRTFDVLVGANALEGQIDNNEAVPTAAVPIVPTVAAPITPDLREGQIDNICLGVGTDTNTALSPGWIDVKITR
jgi:hypothetical protein